MRMASISANQRQTDNADHRLVSYGGFAFFYSHQGRKLCLRQNDRHIQISVGFSPAAVKIRLREGANHLAPPDHEAVGERVSVIPPRQPYVTEWLRQADLVNIYLEPSFVIRAAYGSIRGRVAEVSGRYLIRDRFLEQLAASLRDEMQMGKPNLLYAESIATVAAVHLVRNYARVTDDARNVRGRLSDYWLSRARDYIEAHFGANIGLTDIATELGMSPHYFAELFKNTTGMPPHRYVTKLRIERAKRMLASDEHSIRDIAESLGFGSQSYFTQVFTRWVGTTPRVYRNERRSGLQTA
jgi:AraC family transcriptional regulator